MNIGNITSAVLAACKNQTCTRSIHCFELETSSSRQGPVANRLKITIPDVRSSAVVALCDTQKTGKKQSSGPVTLGVFEGVMELYPSPQTEPTAYEGRYVTQRNPLDNSIDPRKIQKTQTHFHIAGHSPLTVCVSGTGRWMNELN